MSYATEHIASTLKAARESKGLSQRALSKKAGVPQGHISKIENGAVDLRVSSLVALARVLDLELTLVPRNAVSAVKSIMRSSAKATLPDVESARQAGKEMQRLRNLISHMPSELLSKTELEQFRLSPSDIESLREASQLMQEFMSNPDNRNAFKQAQSQFRELRNALAHDRSIGDEIELVRPAYSLDEDDHG